MIAITGAAGFIGSNLAHRLAGLGHDLLLVDLPAAAEDRPAHWSGLGPVEFEAHDRFLDRLNRRGGAVESIFHLGACSSTTETDWDYLRSNNVEYSQRLWEWCAGAGKPFYHASSAATYGDGTLGFDDRTPPDRLKPLNLYGKSKNDFDRWALEQVDEGRPAPPSWAGFKFFNVYGPRESHKRGMASVIWKAKAQILADGEARLFRSDKPGVPDGGQRRDFVFVEDCIDHMLWAREHPEVSGIFNSGTGEARTFEDLALATFAALGREPRIRFIPMPAELIGQYQDYTLADMSKLREAGYSKPPTRLEAGVRRSIDAEMSFEESKKVS